MSCLEEVRPTHMCIGESRMGVIDDGIGIQIDVAGLFLFRCQTLMTNLRVRSCS